MTTEQLFFELIQVAIGTRICLSHTPSVDEWGELYAMAKKQSLVGVCFAGVRRLGANADDGISAIGMPEMLYLTWMGMAAKIQQKNEIVNKQCVEVQQMIEKEGFRTFIMKGQGNAALYKVSKGSTSTGSAQAQEFQEVSGHSDLSLLRQSGDIDIYLEGGFEKVNAFVQSTCPTKEINELEIHYHCLQDTEVEIHYRPFVMRNPFKNRKLQRFFAMEGEKCFENKIALPNGVGEIAVPTTTFNLVHQMVHIAHHLYTDGIGFRQLMDYYFVVKHEMEVKKSSSVREVKKVITEFGLDSFASALMWVIAHVFANTSTGSAQADNYNENFYPWEPCEKDGRMLLEEILKSGNFGHQDETRADLSNKWKSFWYVNGKTFRFWRFDHWAWFWSPLWRVYHFAWRKILGYR